MRLDDYSDKYNAINPLYRKITGMLTGSEMDFSREIFDRFEGVVQFWSTELHETLDCLATTLERMIPVDIDKHPNSHDIKDTVKYIAYLLDGNLMVETRMEKGITFKVPFHQFDCCMGNLKRLEHYLRNVLFRGNIVIRKPELEMPEKLIFGSINVSERCFAGCPFCSIDAKASDDVMELQMIRDLLGSDQVYIPQVYLGDGEIIIHPDPQLPRLIKSLIMDYGIEIHIVTAGLLPQNEDIGIDFFEGLEGLGSYAKDLHITASFSLLNPVANRDLELYIRCMRKTFEMLEMVKGPEYHTVKIQLVHKGKYDGNEQKRTKEAFERARTDLVFDGDYRQPVASGRAAEWGKQGAVSGCARPVFRVRANGDITNHCWNSGTRGSTLGNMYENDAAQIRQSFGVLVQELETIRARNPDKILCELHRTANILMRPSRSDNPIAKRIC
ncbi:radical SAM protein [Candidatus Micrarchaeota archaeon]|nr:radical SAM protein [Candidatus Micrarchaeota archaeon]MBU1887140.1 radical SAM protein [Candidatus Micrarchaeota archaeon]